MVRSESWLDGRQGNRSYGVKKTWRLCDLGRRSNVRPLTCRLDFAPPSTVVRQWSLPLTTFSTHGGCASPSISGLKGNAAGQRNRSEAMGWLWELSCESHRDVCPHHFPHLLIKLSGPSVRCWEAPRGRRHTKESESVAQCCTEN